MTAMRLPLLALLLSGCAFSLGPDVSGQPPPSITVRPSGKRGVTSLSTKARHSSSLTSPPPGLPSPNSSSRRE